MQHAAAHRSQIASDNAASCCASVRSEAVDEIGDAAESLGLGPVAIDLDRDVVAFDGDIHAAAVVLSVGFRVVPLLLLLKALFPTAAKPA